MALDFELVVDKNGKLKKDNSLYYQTTIKASQTAYRELLNLFFNPQETLGVFFDDIFPEDAKYLVNHKDLPKTRAFMPWNGWVFRGMGNADWHLRTSFERMCFNNLFAKDKWFEKEMGLLRDFKRKARNYAAEANFIDMNDNYEYMALFQHYGGATRFLDVTFSFFVALFFAMWGTDFSKKEIITPETAVKGKENEKKDESESDPKKDSKAFSVWCFNRMWIEKKYKKYMPKKILDMYQKYDMYGKDTRIQEEVLNYVPHLMKSGNQDYENDFCSVINMTPYFMNTRLIRQKGSFLFATNPYRTFEENLFKMVDDEKEAWNILKINVEYDNVTLLYLKKCLDEMNINYSVLFDSMDNICKDITLKTFIPGDAVTVSPNAGIGHE